MLVATVRYKAVPAYNEKKECWLIARALNGGAWSDVKKKNRRIFKTLEEVTAAIDWNMARERGACSALGLNHTLTGSTTPQDDYTIVMTIYKGAR